jgi:hypothetical protein
MQAYELSTKPHDFPGVTYLGFVAQGSFPNVVLFQGLLGYVSVRCFIFFRKAMWERAALCFVRTSIEQVKRSVIDRRPSELAGR